MKNFFKRLGYVYIVFTLVILISFLICSPLILAIHFHTMWGCLLYLVILPVLATVGNMRLDDPF